MHPITKHVGGRFPSVYAGDAGTGRRRLYYIVQSEMLDGGVIEAQVVARLRAQGGLTGDVRSTLLFLEPARIAFGGPARSTLAHYRRMWPGGRIAVVPFISRFGPRSAGRALALYLGRERFRSPARVFHGRGAAATLSAHVARSLLGGGRVVLDLRGAGAYEVAHRFGSPFGDNLSEPARRSCEATLQQERRAAAVADFTLTVSHGMRRYACDLLGLSEDSVMVMPSSVEQVTFSAERRRRVRAGWGVADDVPVFVYAGRLGPERLPTHMFGLFARVARLRPDARLVLLLYRNDLDDLNAALASSGVSPSQILTACCPRDDVTEQLTGADVAFFFCEPALRFQCALPIKLAEYLSAGTSVIVNSVATEVANIVRDRRVGWIIDHDLDAPAKETAVHRVLAELASDRLAARRRSLACCADLFLWSRHLPVLRHAYGLEETPLAPERVPVTS